MLRYFLSLWFSVMLMGCTTAEPPSVPPEASTPPEASSEPANPYVPAGGQSLPITAQTELGNQIIQLEVAQTPTEQAIGLMYRTELPDNQGMLFPFNPPRSVQFWMKNVKIPLDMVFVRDGTVRAIAENVPPCTTDTCPTYGPNEPIDQVIELRGGRAAEIGLAVGDHVVIEPLEAPSDQP